LKERIRTSKHTKAVREDVVVDMNSSFR